MTGIDVAAPIAAHRPARHDRAVLMCVDRGFFPYALFLAHQIATAWPARDFDIVIAASEPLLGHPLIDALDLRRVAIDIADLRQGLLADPRMPVATYLRLLVPRALRDDYRRILYLDSDVFYQRGDLSRLLDLEMQGKAVAAVRDLPQIRDPSQTSQDMRELDQPHFKYFNAGVLLLDVDAFLEAAVDHRAFAAVARHGLKLGMHDQSAMNLVLRGDWLELSPVWNFLYVHKNMYFSGFFDVCFFHFCGKRKPFRSGYGGFARRFTEPYRRFLSEHWPEAAGEVQDGLQVDSKAWLHRGVMLFHAANFRRYMRFEDDWRSDFDTR
mgnify:CR=1 FL=1